MELVANTSPLANRYFAIQKYFWQNQYQIKISPFYVLQYLADKILLMDICCLLQTKIQHNQGHIMLGLNEICAVKQIYYQENFRIDISFL